MMEKIKNGLMCVLLMLCSLTVFSCGDDDDDDGGGTGNSKELVGTWEETHSEGYEMDKNGKKYPFILTSEPGELVIIFKADGTIENIEDGERFTAKWSYSGGVLTVTDGKESSTVKILSLTSTSFVMEQSVKYPSGGEIYSKMTFKRVK